MSGGAPQMIAIFEAKWRGQPIRAPNCSLKRRWPFPPRKPGDGLVWRRGHGSRRKADVADTRQWNRARAALRACAGARQGRAEALACVAGGLVAFHAPPRGDGDGAQDRARHADLSDWLVT